MDLRQQSKLSGLLMAREEELVRVWDLEQQIHRILGKPYPLPPPPLLPSRLQTAKKGGKAKERTPGAKIRPLRSDEGAYQVTYDAGDGDTATTLEATADLVRSLLAANQPSLRILRVAAVRFDGSATIPTEQLYPEPQD